MGSQGREALTLETFLALCEAAPAGVRYEAVGGRAVMMAAPSHAHQVALFRLAMVLQASLPDGLVMVGAPVDWVLWQVPTLTVRQPDLVVFTHDQYGRQPLTSPPVLVLEVLSPTTRAVDLVDKRSEYARAGAEHYWVLDVGVPSIEALALDPATRTYVTAAQAKGDEVLDVGAPFRVTVVPGDLLAREDGAWAPRATRH